MDLTSAQIEASVVQFVLTLFYTVDRGSFLRGQAIHLHGLQLFLVCLFYLKTSKKLPAGLVRPDRVGDPSSDLSLIMLFG